MPDIYAFNSKQDVTRVVNATRKVEAQTQSLGGVNGGEDRSGYPFFFATILEEDPANEGRYKVKRVRPADPFIGEWEQTDFETVDRYPAFALTLETGIAPGSIVIAYPLGKDENGLTTYAFNNGNNAGTAFRARISSSALISPNRWQYSVTQVKPASDGLYTEDLEGISSFAYNDAEAENTETGMLGIGVTGQQLIDIGGTLMPVAGVVEVKGCLDCNDFVTFNFGRQNYVSFFCN